LLQSIATTQEALDSAFRRGDAHMQILARNAQARNFFATGEFLQCILALEEVKRGIESSGENNLISEEINFWGLAGLIALRQKKIEQCWVNAETTFNLISHSKVQPTLGFNFFGFAWLVETYATFLTDPQYLDDGKIPLSRQKLNARAEKALGYLTRFAEVFPFAKPRMFLWKGVLKVTLL
jgi:hypothetical protein